MGKVYYNQMDNRWKNHPYPAYPGYEDKTIGTSGCGPTCCAMVVSSGKEIIYPDDMGDIAIEKGYRVPGGTDDGLFWYIGERWGIEVQQIHSSYEAFERCMHGWFVIMACGEGLWTTGGHYILAVGTEGDKIEIFDPYLYDGKFDQYGRTGKVQVRGISCFVQIDTFKEYSNVQRLYAFKVNTEEKPVEPEVPQNTVGQTRTFNKDTIIYEYSNLSGKQYSYLPNTTVEILENLVDVDKVHVYATGREGYIYSVNAYVEDGQTEPITKVMTVTAKIGLNVRTGPSTDYSIITALPYGTEVTVFEESNGWSRIGDGQWVYSEYLS